MLIEDLISNAALTFVKMVEDKDPETHNHLARMSKYSKIIAERLLSYKEYEAKIDHFFIENIYKY